MTSDLNERSSNQGVQFAAIDGHRSSQRAGKAILADGVRSVASDLAARIGSTKD